MTDSEKNTSVRERLVASAKAVIPSTTKTCIWLLKLTVGVSFLMMLLKYFNILPVISAWISPLFSHFGLPGSAALAYVTGYFVNCYSAMAIFPALGLDTRAATILATMVLCSHSMIVETAVLKKTGMPVWRVVLVRTLGAVILGLALNRILPGQPVGIVDAAAAPWELSFAETLRDWAVATIKLVLLMIVIIYSLNILQRILSDFGIMRVIAALFRPLMYIFGLPAHCAFMWIVANGVGLAYGAAAMLDEMGRGDLSRRDILLTDSHIAVCHSNVEDLLLFTALGGVWWIMLLARLALAMVLVWFQRLEFLIIDALSRKNSKLAG